jgi:hypothetical protein
VVIFVKSVQRCIAMAQLLVEQNFPAIAIHRGMTQEERLSRYDKTWLLFRVAERRRALLGPVLRIRIRDPGLGAF